MANKKTTEPNRRSTGTVREPGDGYLENGNPNLAPSAGYDSNPPVQYADESDEQFAKRVDDFETRRQHAEDIENAGGITQDSFDSRKKLLDERYEADLKNLEMRRDNKSK